jgi:hypothetical protein
MESNQSDNAVFNLLTYIAKLEEVTHEYYLLRNKNYIDVLRRKYLLNNGLNDKNEDKNMPWFDRLPELVKAKILEHLDHLSLTKIGLINPNYIPRIINSTKWNYINVWLDNDKLTVDEFKLLVQHLNKNLFKLKIDLKNFDQEINEIFKFSKNLRELRLRNVEQAKTFDAICKNLNHLRVFHVNSNLLTNYNMVKMSNSFRNLKSISIQSKNNLDDGLVILIANLIEIIDFRFEIIQDEHDRFINQESNGIPLKLLINSHAKSLKTINFKGSCFYDDILANLKDCCHLKELKLHGKFNLIGKMSEFIDDLTSLEQLYLHHVPLNFAGNQIGSLRTIISKFKENLTSIELVKIDLRDSDLLKLAQFCPNLVIFKLSECERINDNDLDMALSKMIKLERLYLRHLEKPPNNLVTYKFVLKLNETSNSLLPNIKYLDVKINDNLRKEHPNWVCV